MVETVLITLAIVFVALIWYIRDSINYKKYYKKGMEFIRINSKTEALVEFERAYELNPVHVETLVQLSVLYTENGNLTRAVEIYDQLLKLNNPQNMRNKMVIARRMRDIYMKQRKHDRSYLENKKLLYFNKDELDVKFEIAKFYAGQNRVDRAISLFREILEEDSEHLQANFYIGLCFATKEWINEAIKFLEKTFTLNNNYVMAAYILGFIYKDKMRIDSIEYFDKVIERAKNKELKYNAVRASGLTSIELNFLDNAVKLFRQYLTDDIPESWRKEFGYNLGWAYMLSGNADGAVDEWARIANEDPMFMNVSELIQDTRSVNFNELENEWRIYSANVTYPSVVEYINYSKNYDIDALDDEYERWLVKMEQDEKLFTSVGVKTSASLAKCSIYKFRSIARTMTQAFNYSIKKEINDPAGIDFVAIHNQDTTRVVYMRYRNWANVVDEIVVQNTKNNLGQYGAKIGYLIVCGSFKSTARETAARLKIKLIDGRQLQTILKKL